MDMKERTYTVVLEKEDEGGYHAFCPALKGCHSQGETLEEAVDNIREAVTLYLETLIEDGRSIPPEDIVVKPIRIAV